MPKPLHSKPFELGAAKAGAPFSGANGEAVRVLIWDRKHPTHPILAIEEDGDQEAIAFAPDGSTAHNYDSLVRQLVMLPLGLIDGKPVFVGDEILDSGIPGVAAPMNRDFTHCTWPAPPKVYPQTGMTGDDLYGVYDQSSSSINEGMVAVANAALRHAVDAGQVYALPFDSIMHVRDLSPDVIEKQIGAKLVELGWMSPESRATRDMAIAYAVIDQLKEDRGLCFRDVNLTAAIAKVAL